VLAYGDLGHRLGDGLGGEVKEFDELLIGVAHGAPAVEAVLIVVPLLAQMGLSQARIDAHLSHRDPGERRRTQQQQRLCHRLSCLDLRLLVRRRALGGGAAERTATHQEPNIEGREAMTEALLLLSAAPVARVAMREMGIYPCLREAHLCEEGDDDEHGLNSGRAVRDANEQLVELFYLSAEAVAQPMAKVSVSEHSVSEQTAVDERVPAAADDVVSAEIPD